MLYTMRCTKPIGVCNTHCSMQCHWGMQYPLQYAVPLRYALLIEICHTR
jgi:hypothetical protein